MSFVDDIFLEARTYRSWQDRPVDPLLLQKIHDMASLGATSANGCPLRIVYITSLEAKEKLRPCLDEGNVKKTMSAPVTALFAMDLEFYTLFPKLNPNVAEMFQELYGANPMEGERAARLNATLQAAYYMLAARACGLDCGPMSGFDVAKADGIFFSGKSLRSLFLCNLGYGIKEELRPRLPRLSFEEVAQVV